MTFIFRKKNILFPRILLQHEREYYDSLFMSKDTFMNELIQCIEKRNMKRIRKEKCEYIKLNVRIQNIHSPHAK